MQYDPKLKKAMAEIREILKKYDCAAMVVLHRPGYSEFLRELQTSYSAVVLSDNEKIHIKATVESYGNAEKRNRAIRDTANMLMHLTDIPVRLAMDIVPLREKLDTMVEHYGDDLTSGSTQNN